MSLSRAQNIFMPANINSIVISAHSGTIAGIGFNCFNEQKVTQVTAIVCFDALCFTYRGSEKEDSRQQVISKFTLTPISQRV